MQWDDAIKRVLSEADRALHYTEIAERIISEEYRHSVGATPAATVASYLSTSLRDKSSPYLRVGGGQYTLKAVAEKGGREQAVSGKRADDAVVTGALRAFGMFWHRDQVLWSGKPTLLGRQGTGATNVNFADQIGVYLLHDRERVIYVGRASDSLSVRLKAHTTDRLSGRWDRFSWFGVRGVQEGGELLKAEASWGHDVVIDTMEALLIESLEPPLNRRRGDNLSSVEFTQVADQQIDAEKLKGIVDKMTKS